MANSSCGDQIFVDFIMKDMKNNIALLSDAWVKMLYIVYYI